MFANLAIINALTIFNFKRSVHDINQKSVYIVSSIQTLLLNLPTLYIAFKIACLAIKKLTRRHRCRKKNQASVEIDLELLTEREEEMDLDSYSKMTEDDLVSTVMKNT